MPSLSVIICTHNPREDYFRRTLEALKAQTLARDEWELLLVDNASEKPLAGRCDLSWHPRSRHVREEELGIAAARMRGFKEAAADVLVYVDDDNILAPDYLSQALALSRSHPWVGAFGGCISAEFETPPEDWISCVLPILAVMNVTQEQWTCSPGTSALMMAPVTAGGIIRRKVAAHWAGQSASDPLRRSIGRKGAVLNNGEDTDMVLCSCALGLAVGRFPQLRLTHLIPSRRLKREYILRLVEGTVFSNGILKYIWDGQIPGEGEKISGAEKIFRAYKNLRFRLSHWMRPNFYYEHMLATQRGMDRAAEFIRADKSKRAAQ